jgi:hypothetical protein
MTEKRKEMTHLKNDILKALRKSHKPLSTQDLSLKLSKPWHSVQTRCLQLQVDEKIEGFRVGRINLWMSKRRVMEDGIIY